MEAVSRYWADEGLEGLEGLEGIGEEGGEEGEGLVGVAGEEEGLALAEAAEFQEHSLKRPPGVAPRVARSVISAQYRFSTCAES